jgi:hypothetical protein
MRPGRILLKIPMKTVADRRARRAIPTVPAGETEFSPSEQAIFSALDRRAGRTPGRFALERRSGSRK